MKLFIIDTETTGLSENDQICEIAGTLYQVDANKQNTGFIASTSTLLPITIANHAEGINCIPAELTRASREFSEQSLALFKTMAIASDYCVAFNAKFDAPRIDTLIGKQKWLCAMQDFDWGYTRINAYGGYKLIDLALWMGIGISTAHRAADDVRLLVECMNRKPNLQEMVEQGIGRSQSSTLELQALVSYNDKDLAKSAGFAWDGMRRIWVKQIKECDSAAFIESLDCLVPRNALRFETTVLSIDGKTHCH
jgi:DNA polymerase-3 subunit epsilon